MQGVKSLKNEIVVIFQPHRYSRTKILINDFVDSLSKIKYLILLNTYSAGEKRIEGFTSKDIYFKILKIKKLFI